MSVTPEGKVKAEVKKVLDKYKPGVYYEMNVPMGYGKSGLDFIGSAWGHAFAIETKRAGKYPTDRQEGTRDDMALAGMQVFRIIGLGACGELQEWLDMQSELEGF